MSAIEGATVVDVTLPEEWNVLTGNDFNNVRLPERSEPFIPFLREDLRQFGVSVMSWLQGVVLGADEYVTGQRAKLLLLERVLDDLFEQCDVVVQTNPVPFDIIGLPELALPIGFPGVSRSGRSLVALPSPRSACSASPPPTKLSPTGTCVAQWIHPVRRPNRRQSTDRRGASVPAWRIAGDRLVRTTVVDGSAPRRSRSSPNYLIEEVGLRLA